MTPRAGWPKHPVIYEIYPRSFRDTTGSGVGDLCGIAERLEHVVDLGADAIWIAPFYESPMIDGGYDITDHRAVDPRFGTLADFDHLVGRAHDLGLRVMTDMVFNHTSDQHEWFQAGIDGDEAMARRYVWRDAKPDGTPPNNWLSFFGEPAWTWNPVRQQYYLRQFLACQPSLDLRHEPVLDDLREIIRFWRDRGVDGFRFDAVTSCLFDPSMKDNPPAREQVQRRNAVGLENPYSRQDHVYDMLPGDGAELALKLREWAGADAWLIGEINSGNRSVELTSEFTAPDRLDAGYTVDLMVNPIDAANVRDLVERHRNAGCGLAYCLSCHDQPRAVSRAGDGSAEEAKLLALLSVILPGPLLIWQGEELGQRQADLALNEIVDPFDRLFHPVEPGRDGARIPFPWSSEAENFGFSSGTPWLPMRDLSDVALDTQRPDGVLQFWREALALRRRIAPNFEIAALVEADVLTIHRGPFVAQLNFTTEDRPRHGPPALLQTRNGPEGVLPARTGLIWRE